jgi:hypothetical protein
MYSKAVIRRRPNNAMAKSKSTPLHQKKTQNKTKQIKSKKNKPQENPTKMVDKLLQ